MAMHTSLNAMRASIAFQSSCPEVRFRLSLQGSGPVTGRVTVARCNSEQGRPSPKTWNSRAKLEPIPDIRILIAPSFLTVFALRNRPLLWDRIRDSLSISLGFGPWPGFEENDVIRKKRESSRVWLTFKMSTAGG